MYFVCIQTLKKLSTMAQINYKTTLLLLFCLVSFGAMAQSTAEQLKKYTADANKAEDDEEYMAIMKSADSFAKKMNDVEGQATVARSVGNHYYNTDADECIKYLQKAFRLYSTAGNKKEATYCLQNIALAYEDKKKDYAEAMKYVRRAINARIELKDTMEMANMYKYQGYVFGKMHNFPEGKKSAAKAVQLYTIKNYQPGLAVTYRDLAIVYEEEREYDSSIALMLKAKAIWSTGENKTTYQSRIYGNNSDLVRIYTKDGKMEDAETLVHENEAINATDFQHTEVLAFYKEGRDFYSKNKDKDNSKIYKEKYADLRQTMKDKGANVD